VQQVNQRKDVGKRIKFYEERLTKNFRFGRSLTNIIYNWQYFFRFKLDLTLLKTGIEPNQFSLQSKNKNHSHATFIKTTHQSHTR
jgi:hypothetical protein